MEERWKNWEKKFEVVFPCSLYLWWSNEFSGIYILGERKESLHTDFFISPLALGSGKILHFTYSAPEGNAITHTDPQAL
jgi:hypothetical protein